MQQEPTDQTLRRWAAALVFGNRPAFNHEAKFDNKEQYIAFCSETMVKAHRWMWEQNRVAAMSGKSGEYCQLYCLGYKFKVSYVEPKHINQADTAIQTYHTSNFSGQEMALARFILNSAVPVSTRSALDHFRENKHEGGPDELNSASRAMNSLKREGVTIDGTRYWLQLAETKPNEGTGKPADFFRLVKAEENKIQQSQQTLFEI